MVVRQPWGNLPVAMSPLTSALLDCDGSTAALLGQGSFPLGLAEVDLALENYQAGMLPAGSYNYVVTLTVTP